MPRPAPAVGDSAEVDRAGRAAGAVFLVLGFFGAVAISGKGMTVLRSVGGLLLTGWRNEGAIGPNHDHKCSRR